MAWCHLLFETLLVWKFVTQIINSYLFHIQITFSHYIFLFWINETAIPVCFLNFLILSSICEMNPIFLLTFACKVDAYQFANPLENFIKLFTKILPYFRSCVPIFSFHFLKYLRNPSYRYGNALDWIYQRWGHF